MEDNSKLWRRVLRTCQDGIERNLKYIHGMYDRQGNKEEDG